jgi:hypothetical protein
VYFFIVFSDIEYSTKGKGVFIKIMKSLFTAGIFTLVGLISFAFAYFLKNWLNKNYIISCTLLIASITLVKLFEFRDQMFD